MTLTLQFLLLGLGSGAVFAALALGVVLTYRATGVVNFAYGAIAAYPAYAFNAMRSTGDLVLPFIGLPESVPITSGKTPVVPAMLIALGMAAFIGLAVHYLVFRPLRRAPVLARVVAGVGVMVVLQAIVLMRFGTSTFTAPSILPTGAVRFGGIAVGVDRLWLAGLAVSVAVILAVVYKFTAFGMKTRAAGQDEKGAVLLGLSPDAFAAANAVIGAVIAGFFGIVVGSITATDSSTFSLLIIPSLGAALVASFTSFARAAIAGLVIGMLQAAVVRFEAIWDWYPQRTGDVLPFVVIGAAMVILGARLPGRDTLGSTRLPTALKTNRPVLLGGVGLAIAIALTVLMEGPFLTALTTSFIYILICLSVVVLTGLVGQISLAQMTVAGLAAYLLSELTTSLGWPLLPGVILAVVAAVVAGVLVGLPALRVRGVNLAVITLALGFAVQSIVFNSSRYAPTGGAVVPPLTFFGTPVTGKAFTLVCLTVAALACAAVFWLRSSNLGLRMLAVRANERAAAAVGISPERTKLLAFAIASGLAGLGGVLLGFEQQTVTPSTFDVFVSLGLLTSAYLGGIACVSGGVVGSFLATGGLVAYALTRLFDSAELVVLISGLGLILTTILNPEGIVGATRDMVFAARRRLTGDGAPRAGQNVKQPALVGARGEEE